MDLDDISPKVNGPPVYFTLCYIYLLFVWMGCKKQIKRLFSVTLPSAMAMTLGKVTTWEHALPSAKAIALGKHHRFAECHGARHSAKVAYLPSVLTGHSANRLPLPSVLPMALRTVATFVECLSQRRSAKR